MCYYEKKDWRPPKENKINYETQYGFMKGGRPDHCLYVLDYIATWTYSGIKRDIKPLYYAFIDFKKAYDYQQRKIDRGLSEIQSQPLYNKYDHSNVWGR